MYVIFHVISLLRSHKKPTPYGVLEKFGLEFYA